MGKIFIRGLMAITPIAITLAILIWLYNILEGAFSIPMKHLVGEDLYFSGFGIIIAFIFIFIIGAIVNTLLVQKLYSLSENFLKRIPLIKTLYNSVCDITSFFKSTKKNNKDCVVMAEIWDARLIGIVTRETFEDLPEGLQESEDEIAVFLPLSYQIGGFTVMLPRSRLKKIDMSIEYALRFATTAWLPSDQSPKVDLESLGRDLSDS